MKLSNPLSAVSSLALLMALLPGSMACSSLPLEIQPQPGLPSRSPLSSAPRAPKAPVLPVRPEVKRPEAPAGRRQTLDEVYSENFSIDSVPVIFPFSKQDQVVVSVPPGTSSQHRVALIGAFLAAGFPVKDAGEFGGASFQVSSSDENRDLSGFQRLVVMRGDRGTESNMVLHPGLQGMDFRLTDPTSLWAPDLLSNPSLAAPYFLRIFEFSFENVTDKVMLNQVFDKQAVTKFRAEVGALNQEYMQYNSNLASYMAEALKYQSDFNDYIKLHEKWERDERRQYERRFAGYLKSWKAWRKENDAAIAEKIAQGSSPKNWDAPSAGPGLESAGFDIEKALLSPDPIDLQETAELEASIADRREVGVPARQLNLLAEIIDAESGRVVWVANARSRARDTWSDARLLMETVGRMTTSKR